MVIKDGIQNGRSGTNGDVRRATKLAVLICQQ